VEIPGSSFFKHSDGHAVMFADFSSKKFKTLESGRDCQQCTQAQNKVQQALFLWKEIGQDPSCPRDQDTNYYG